MADRLYIAKQTEFTELVSPLKYGGTIEDHRLQLEYYLHDFIADQSDYYVFLGLLQNIFNDIKSVADNFETLADVNNVVNIFLPKLAYLMDYTFRYDLSDDVNRDIIKRLLYLYKHKGRDKEVLEAADFANNENWISNTLFVPTKDRPIPVPDDRTSTLYYPVDMLFTWSVSEYDVNHRYSDSVRWRDGVVVIEAENLNNAVREAVKRVLPAGLKAYYDSKSELYADGLNGEEVGYGKSLKFKDWILNLRYTLDYFLRLEPSVNSDRWSENYLNYGFVWSGRRILFPYMEIERTTVSSMLPLYGIYPNETYYDIFNVLKKLESSVPNFISYFTNKSNTWAAEIINRTTEYLNDSSNYINIVPQISDNVQLNAYGYTGWSGSFMLVPANQSDVDTIQYEIESRNYINPSEISNVVNTDITVINVEDFEWNKFAWSGQEYEIIPQDLIFDYEYELSNNSENTELTFSDQFLLDLMNSQEFLNVVYRSILDDAWALIFGNLSDTQLYDGSDINFEISFDEENQELVVDYEFSVVFEYDYDSIYSNYSKAKVSESSEDVARQEALIQLSKIASNLVNPTETELLTIYKGLLYYDWMRLFGPWTDKCIHDISSTEVQPFSLTCQYEGFPTYNGKFGWSAKYALSGLSNVCYMQAKYEHIYTFDEHYTASEILDKIPALDDYRTGTLDSICKPDERLPIDVSMYRLMEYRGPVDVEFYDEKASVFESSCLNDTVNWFDGIGYRNSKLYSDLKLTDKFTNNESVEDSYIRKDEREHIYDRRLNDYCIIEESTAIQFSDLKLKYVFQFAKNRITPIVSESAKLVPVNEVKLTDFYGDVRFIIYDGIDRHKYIDEHTDEMYGIQLEYETQFGNRMYKDLYLHERPRLQNPEKLVPDMLLNLNLEVLGNFGLDTEIEAFNLMYDDFVGNLKLKSILSPSKAQQLPVGEEFLTGMRRHYSIFELKLNDTVRVLEGCE